MGVGRGAGAHGDGWGFAPLAALVDSDRTIAYGIVQPGVPTSDGVPIVRVTDIRGGRISISDPLQVSHEIESRYSRTRLRGGELLLTLVGTVGESAVVPDRLAGWNTARAVAVIPVRKDIGSYWVQLALRSPDVRHIIDSRLNTTVQATLNLRDVAQLPIVLPPERERRAIAHVLGTLDDRIELNRQMNATLESIAQAIFKSWFVDFDPVRAKAEGREPEGMDAETAALFPSEFEESELGPIPKGWQVEDFNSIADLSKDTVTPARSPDVEFEHYSLPAFDSGQVPIRELGEGIKSNKTLIPSNSVLISKLNPHISRVWYVGSVGEHAVCSTEFLVWVPASRVSAAFLYSLARSSRFAGSLCQLVTGTSNSHQRVKPAHMSTIQIVRAPHSVIQAFSRIVEPLLNQVLANRSRATLLADLRDTLLPRLISGRLRVPEAEEMLAAIPSTP